MSSSTPAPKKSRRGQIAETFRMAKRGDPRLGLILLGTFVVAAALGFLVFQLLPGSGWLSMVLSVISALLVGTLATLIVFGRRAQSSMYRQIEDQPGSGGAALRMLRRGWDTSEVIAFNRQQDVVHRAVGRAGIVLIAEGNPNRTKQLLAAEKRKHERVTADTPITEVVVGRGEGQVPLPKLVKHLQKLPKAIRPAEMTDVLYRLKALDAQRGKVPLPKGPLPTNMKGMRSNMRGR
ncbi:DUF4191 domain-containing protein [Nocardioides zeae]|uniref:DUF4191 domain-containing protein n=1 Tax=Nocardioides imazamoxiresistens TaxID=3231893 RepID=A0ABU3PTV9_9ACTN|nr:DUF4191 domain-containing protein [Nocardioides zeae]MDT9592619.1 DUF4191 domain-containing protein [Nocardioides zeae]